MCGGRDGEEWYLFLRNTIQHVIVEMTFVQENSVLREKKVILYLTTTEIGFEVQVTMK